MTHGERYSYMEKQIKGSELTKDQVATLYLLSCEEELFEKSKTIVQKNIDFGYIKKRLTLNQKEFYLLVEVAENLSRWNFDCKMTPHMIAELNSKHFHHVMIAIHISADKCHINLKGGDMKLEFSSLEEKENMDYLNVDKQVNQTKEEDAYWP